MRPLTVHDAADAILALQDEIRRQDESRYGYDHRLHGLLLVARGMPVTELSHVLGDCLRTVQSWLKRFEDDGLSGLVEGDRPGRSRRFTEAQMCSAEEALRRRPHDVELPGDRWDGKTLSAFLERRFEVELGVRQCQRLFSQLGSRLTRPRTRMAHGDPIVRAASTPR
jgi:transposase